MNIIQSTRHYERWLDGHTPLIRAELHLKHRLMRKSRFPFLRATFYRWAQIWPEIGGELAQAPNVLGVGDLHVENFGTWRDVEGRLVWGINDFDEAAPQAYTNDLVRLVTSALLAKDEGMLRVNQNALAEAVLQGYCDGWEACGRPFLLGEKNKRLLQMAQGEMRGSVVFWRKMDLLTESDGVPVQARRAIQSLMPEPGIRLTFVHRIAGVGSLGRQRFVGLGEWRGGRAAREAKSMAPSAFVWAGHANPGLGCLYQKVLDSAVRAPDPCVRLQGSWLVRRLSPDCSRINLEDLPAKRDELRLLYCMGWETANVHLGTPKAGSRIKADLKKRESEWLLNAARRMVLEVSRDWKQWRQNTGR